MNPPDDDLLTPNQDPLSLADQVEAFVRSLSNDDGTPSSGVEVARRVHLDDVAEACARHGQTELLMRVLTAVPLGELEITARRAWSQAVAAGQVALMEDLLLMRDQMGCPITPWERMAAIHGAVRAHGQDPVVSQIIQVVGVDRPLDEACEMFGRSDDPQDLVNLLVAVPAHRQEQLLAQWPLAAEPARAILRHRQAQHVAPVDPPHPRLRPRA